MDMKRIQELITEMKNIQKDFLENYGVDDIWSNSKVFEIMIANSYDHIMIPGHSGSKDAEDINGNIFEYKHFKQSSSNHSWTFNDFSDETISSLNEVESVIFAHINDVDYEAPGKFDWCYEVPGQAVANYLEIHTKDIKNSRKMINISPTQIESRLKVTKTYIENTGHRYSYYLERISNIINELESLTNARNLLTSNKFWELIVALELNHDINSEQGGREGAHDAFDNLGRTYEYKVSKKYSWDFQDISENVLKKYLDDYKIILAIVNKTTIEVTDIYSAEPSKVVPRLKEKLQDKAARNNGELRRLQVSLSKGDLEVIKATRIL